MSWIQILLSGTLLAAGAFTFASAIFTGTKKGVIYKYFAGLNLCMSFYTFGYGMELYSTTHQQMLFWNGVQYIGLPGVAAFWIFFSLSYANRKMRKSTILCVALIPLISMICRFTMPMNTLYYTGTEVYHNGLFPVLLIFKGPWYWVQAVFDTVSFFIGNVVYLRVYKHSTGVIRRQSLLLLVASLFPWVFLILNLTNASPLRLDYTPFSMTLAMILFFFAFVRLQFLNIKPMAREKVFQSTEDGVLVLDRQYQIIDVNPAARKIFQELDGVAIGGDVRQVLENYSSLIESVIDCSETQCQVDGNHSTYKVHTVHITEDNGDPVGYLTILSDITRYVQMMSDLDFLASRDALTGVFNRRQFNQLCEEALSNDSEVQSSPVMILLDLDFFKKVNDRYGHQGGDEVLKQVALICKNMLRPSDIMGRYGGEEFTLFLPEATTLEATGLAEQIRSCIENADIHYQGKRINVTASFGVSSVSEAEKVTLDRLIKQADDALYQAKANGRNQVCIYNCR